MTKRLNTIAFVLVIVSCCGLFILINRRGQDLRYVYPSENEGWEKYGDSPVFGDNSTGTIFDPFLYVDGDSLIMFASERKTGNIIRTSSIDGIHWCAYTKALGCKPYTWQHIVNRATVVKNDLLWYMYYTGQSPDTSRIGIAVSSDGVHFHSNDNPIIVASDEEGVSVMNPCVLYAQGLYKMWYAAGENYEPDALYYAESKDGLLWTKRQEPVLTKDVSREWEKAKVGGCCVVPDSDGGYSMYYIGYQTIDIARICLAKSLDGISWTRPARNLLISPSKGSWDADATYKPSVLEFKGDTLMWYNGRTLDKEYIGLAVKHNYCK